MRYRRRKVDANQAEIVTALKSIGCSVVDLSALGGGAPDLLAGRGGKNWLFEVKDPKRIGKKPRGAWQIATEERQAKFRAAWYGQVVTVSSGLEAVVVVENG